MMPPVSSVGPGAFLYPFFANMAVSVKQSPAVGFPPPLLGEEPLRLPVLADADDWFALAKSAGVGARAHPWDKLPDLDVALNSQLQAQKPELLRLGATLFGSVYYLDPEATGVALFAKNRDALKNLRNQFGSGECRFRFHFLAAQDDDAEAEFRADAPLLAHRLKPKYIPSTAKGKKSFTDFRRLAESGQGWALWEAQTDFFRPHQVRAHAATHGIPALGDALYGGPASPTLRELPSGARRPRLDKPLFSGLALHLSLAEVGADDSHVRARAPLPWRFALLLKRLELSEPS